MTWTCCWPNSATSGNGAVYAPLLEALLAAAQTLDAKAPSQGVSPTTTDLSLPAEHAESLRAWLEGAMLRASSGNDNARADALARIWASMR
jgi:hypothetical protein